MFNWKQTLVVIFTMIFVSGCIGKNDPFRQSPVDFVERDRKSISSELSRSNGARCLFSDLQNLSNLPPSVATYSLFADDVLSFDVISKAYLPVAKRVVNGKIRDYYLSIYAAAKGDKNKISAILSALKTRDARCIEQIRTTAKGTETNVDYAGLDGKVHSGSGYISNLLVALQRAELRSKDWHAEISKNENSFFNFAVASERAVRDRAIKPTKIKGKFSSNPIPVPSDRKEPLNVADLINNQISLRDVGTLATVPASLVDEKFEKTIKRLSKINKRAWCRSGARSVNCKKLSAL